VTHCKRALLSSWRSYSTQGQSYISKHRQAVPCPSIPLWQRSPPCLHVIGHSTISTPSMLPWTDKIPMHHQQPHALALLQYCDMFAIPDSIHGRAFHAMLQVGALLCTIALPHYGTHPSQGCAHTPSSTVVSTEPGWCCGYLSAGHGSGQGGYMGGWRWEHWGRAVRE
jgi:hypothetical protein